MTTKKCKHEDGWVSQESICINPDGANDDNIAEFECNTIGCKVKKKFRFDIENITEVKT